jgi:tetratricopeptide (TPR) repeat protein
MAEDDFLLDPGELQYRQRRRRLLLSSGIAILFLLIAGFFAAPRVRSAIHGMQARRHAKAAFVLIDQQKWREARDEASAAYQLRPNEPEALRAVARLLSQIGQADGLTFWKNLAAVTPLTRDDLRQEANLALKTNDLAAADEATQQLLQSRDGKPTAGDVVVAADVCLRKRQFDKATDFAKKALADSTATRQDQLQAVIVLDAVLRNGGAGQIGDLKQLDARIAEIANGTDQTSLDALMILAQRILNPPAEPKNLASPIRGDELVERINNHPLAKPQHKLFAADVEIAQHPDQREAIEKRVVDHWKSGTSEELAALGAWLYRRGEFQKELDAIPLERATQTRDLFLQHVDALGALNRWDEIRRILENERFPLDPVIQNMYLARCFAQQGQEKGAENGWQRALEHAAGDLTKLIMLGEYAEKNGAHQIANTTFEAAAAVSPKSRPAQLGRLRAAYDSGDTKKVHAILLELLKIWPNDSGLLNDEAYTHLLLLPPELKPESPELKDIETLANKLVQNEPASLPHRTLLALALLKQNRPYSALGVYRNLAVPQNAVSPSTVAVHAAVLAASGQSNEAHNEFKTIPTDKLLPEEKILISNL